jgi:hypothetical protein
VELLNRLIVRVFVGLGLGVASLLWRPLAGTSHWTREIYRGELMLLAVATLGTGIAQAALAKVQQGFARTLRVLVIGPGIFLLVITLGVYSEHRSRVALPGGRHPSFPAAAATSYRFAVAAIMVAMAATYLTYRSDVEAIERGHM